MSLIANVLDGLAGAVLTASVGGLAIKRSRPSSKQYDDAWKKQAGELQAALDAQYQQRIEYLERQCADRDREITGKDKEIARVQRLLGRAQRGDRDD